VLLNPKTGILRGKQCNPLLSWRELHRPAAMADILRCHDYGYVRTLMDFCGGLGDTEIGKMDPDTTVSRESYNAATEAAGMVCEAVDLLANNTYRAAFCAVRPPGHHAGPSGTVACENDPHGSMGFCLLNNAAIGAAYARHVYRHKGIRKVAILDFDVHHGNGTEAIVQNLSPQQVVTPISVPGGGTGEIKTWAYKPWLDDTDASEVFFSSVSGYGRKGTDGPWFYPGNGGTEQRGSIMNVGIGRKQTPAASRLAWRRAWRDRVLPKLVAFDADMIFICAGFDGHARDEVNYGYLGLLEEDYAWLTNLIVQVANRCCEGRVVSVLEGGYRIQGFVTSAFALSVEAHVHALSRRSLAKWDGEEQGRELERELAAEAKVRVEEEAQLQAQLQRLREEQKQRAGEQVGIKRKTEEVDEGEAKRARID
jgi:acetoin utilization deacetylase AcuC-like enzyme